MAENKNKRAPRFKIQLAGEDEVRQRVLGKMGEIRKLYQEKYDRTVTNTDIIDASLSELFGVLRRNTNYLQINPHVSAQRQQNIDGTLEPLFVTSGSCIEKMIHIAQQHSRHCSGNLQLSSDEKVGHVLRTKMTCNKRRAKHQYRWSSSPYMPDGKYLANKRMAFGYLTSGMLPIQYSRMCDGANIGEVSRRELSSITHEMYQHARTEQEESTLNALREEIGNYPNVKTGIDIQTDARHGWRKNSKDSTVVCLGEMTKKVLVCENVSTTDDPIAQRHEKIGTERIYDKLEDHEKSDSAVYINVHAHDNNASINKLAEERAQINQNETWHGVKALKKSLKAVANGTLKTKGVAWHPQLSDKVSSVCTHVRWALRNCNSNAEILRSRILTCVEHHKGNHENCSETSRCKRDPNYESSTINITSPVAENLLRNVLLNSSIYKKAENFRLARDTYYVESFNNTMNKFHDKRIAFSTDQYRLRSDLAVLHWNENVNRRFTSRQTPGGETPDPNRPGKKNLAAATHKYVPALWNTYMNSLYS